MHPKECAILPSGAMIDVLNYGHNISAGEHLLGRFRVLRLVCFGIFTSETMFAMSMMATWAGVLIATQNSHEIM